MAPESDPGLLPPIELDPDIERTINLGATSGEACLAEGEEFHRYQLPLHLPTNTVSIRMKVEDPNWGSLVPGLSVFKQADGPPDRRGRDANSGELNTAQLDNLPLERGLYIISAWSLRGFGCYTLEVAVDGLSAFEAQAAPPAPQPVPKSSQEDDSESAATGSAARGPHGHRDS